MIYCDTCGSGHDPDHPHLAWLDEARQRRHTTQGRFARLISTHVQISGWLCPGATDLYHDPHPSTMLTVDHITPISVGGTNASTNLRVLCELANSYRGARWSASG